jgi:hypothetical protein
VNTETYAATDEGAPHAGNVLSSEHGRTRPSHVIERDQDGEHMSREALRLPFNHRDARRIDLMTAFRDGGLRSVHPACQDPAGLLEQRQRDTG